MPGKDRLPTYILGFWQGGGLSSVVVHITGLSGRSGPFPPGDDGGNDGILSPERVVGGSEKATDASLDSNLDGLATAENLVQAFGAIDDLVPLSGHENVSCVRLPRRSGPDEHPSDPIHP